MNKQFMIEGRHLNSAHSCLIVFLFLVTLNGCSTESSNPKRMTEMSIDPISRVRDQTLTVDRTTIQQLLQLRQDEKFADLPGTDTSAERERLTTSLNDLLDSLIAGIESNPNKIWAMQQFQFALLAVEMEDTEARERFGDDLEKVMDILKIESSDGLLNFYL